MAYCLRCESLGRVREATETWEDEPSCGPCFDARNEAAHEAQYAAFHGGSDGPSQADDDAYRKDTGR